MGALPSGWWEASLFQGRIQHAPLESDLRFPSRKQPSSQPHPRQRSCLWCRPSTFEFCCHLQESPLWCSFLRPHLSILHPWASHRCHPRLKEHLYQLQMVSFHADYCCLAKHLFMASLQLYACLVCQPFQIQSHLPRLDLKPTFVRVTLKSVSSAWSRQVRTRHLQRLSSTHLHSNWRRLPHCSFSNPYHFFWRIQTWLGVSDFDRTLNFIILN